MNTHTFLVKDDEGVGQGDIGNCEKGVASFTDQPDEQTGTIAWGLLKGPIETFAALTYRLGPSTDDPTRPTIKKGSTILSATLRVNPTATISSNFDMRIATMKKDGIWDQDDVTLGGSFSWGPIIHVELDSDGGDLAYNPATTTASSNNRLRSDGTTPGYGRRAIGTQGLTSIVSPPGTLNRVICSYDTFPAGVGDEVWMEVYEKGAEFFDRGALLATSDPHTSLPAAEPGFEVNSRAFTFSGSDRITIEDATRYVFVLTTNSATDAPRVFMRLGQINFLDAGVAYGIGNGFGAPGYNSPDEFSSLLLTNDGSDTLLTNHIGTPITFLNVAGWTAGVDFDFTGLDSLVQDYIDDASYSDGDPICLVLDPFQGDGMAVETRAGVSINSDNVGLELIITWLDPDETAPLVTIDDPNDLDILSGTTTINATATDPQGSNEVSPAGVAIVRAILNPGNMLIGTDAVPVGDVYSIAFDTTLFADGTYTLRVEADDAASPLNTGFDEITISIDNIPDFLAITESQLSLTGLSSVSDRTQAANLRVTEPSVAKPRGGSQIIVKKET